MPPERFRPPRRSPRCRDVHKPTRVRVMRRARRVLYTVTGRGKRECRDASLSKDRCRVERARKQRRCYAIALRFSFPAHALRQPRGVAADDTHTEHGRESYASAPCRQQRWLICARRATSIRRRAFARFVAAHRCRAQYDETRKRVQSVMLHVEL